jgi:cytochrome c-type biogenesis protein
MTALDVTHFGAFMAGLLSFLSPCVLPLVPPYLCFLAGTSFDEMAKAETGSVAMRRLTLSSGAFVLGFATVFVILGATATAISAVLAEYNRYFAIGAGIVIALFGLHMMGLFRIGFLMREARFHVERRPVGIAGAYVIGLAFAFGWTPCVGPVLAGVLAVAASKSTAVDGAVLLGSYAAGMGLPFLAAAIASGPFLRFMQRFRRHLGTMEKVMGGLLIATGAMIAFGSFEIVGFWLLEAFPALGRLG